MESLYKQKNQGLINDLKNIFRQFNLIRES